MSSGCKEFCLHKMSDGSVDPACVMNAFRYSVPDGRVVELNVPTLADWTQQHPDGLVGTRVSQATPAACEGSCGRDLDEPAGRPDDEGCWPDTAQKLHADR